MAIGWTGAILFATLSPSRDEPLFDITVPHFDKVVHFGLFFIHAALLTLGLNIKYKSIAITAGGFLLAIITEGLQNYVPGRQADVLDGIADLCGTVAGMMFVYFIHNQEVRG